jgi:hypothetical protein
MWRAWFVWVALVLSQLPVLVEAASSHSRVKKPILSASEKQDVVQDISLPMAKGELQEEVAAEQAQRERANAPKTKLEAGVSTWQPNAVNLPSRIRSTGAFHTSGLPTIEAGLFSPLSRQLHLEFGVGLLALKREATLQTSGLKVKQEQDAYITFLRLGVAYSPWSLLGDTVTPYVSGALRPALIVTRRSAFDDGVSQVGIPFEAGAGAVVRIVKPVSLDLGVSQVFGSVQDSDMKGFALHAGVRVPI